MLLLSTEMVWKRKVGRLSGRVMFLSSRSSANSENYANFFRKILCFRSVIFSLFCVSFHRQNTCTLNIGAWLISGASFIFRWLSAKHFAKLASSFSQKCDAGTALNQTNSAISNKKVLFQRKAVMLKH